MTPWQIIELMDRLGESSAEFAARFGVSKRTVQDWRQGRRKPHPTVLQLLRELDKRFTKR